MKLTQVALGARLVFIIATLVVAWPVLGQVADPPPELPKLDINGVSIPDGTSIIEQKDVSIGPAQGGISLVRYINAKSKRSNLISDLTVYESGGTGRVAVATFSNASDTFISDTPNIFSSSYSKYGSGATLSIEGQNPVYITAEGVKIYYALSGIYVSNNSTYYLADKAVFPNGETWRWSWKTAVMNGARGIRLQGVENNLGYQIKISYKSNSLVVAIEPPWLQFDKVIAVNKAYEYCDSSADACTFSQSWPMANYDTAWSPTRIETIVSPTGAQTKVRWTAENLYIKTPSSPAENINFRIVPWYDCLNDVDKTRLFSIVKNGKTWQYIWDDKECLATLRTLVVQDPNGKATTYTYYPLSRFETSDSPSYDMSIANPFQLVSMTDPDGRLITYQYDEFYRIKKITMPEQDFWQYFYDARGNITSIVRHPKPGYGQADVAVESKTYPATCADYRTCNKPLTVTDAKGNTHTFTYDPAHGGVLTETGPVVGGVVPVKRYGYVQRYAWIKNASGVYVQANDPVWLLAEERLCRSTATVGSGCSGGAADEVVTSYDYGPNSGPNNLLLRGVAVTADGETQRTCYSYDSWGNKISETSPRAGLTGC